MKTKQCSHCNKEIKDRMKTYQGKRYCQNCFHVPDELHKKNMEVYQEIKAKRQTEVFRFMNEHQLIVGDVVSWFAPSLFGIGGKEITGKIATRNGIPCVRLNEKQYCSDGKQYRYTKLHAGWRKI